MNKKSYSKLLVSVLAGVVIAPVVYASAFSNQGSIRNTVHNLTQDTLYVVVGQQVNPMQARRNDYGEVCVYCHTPHGGSSGQNIANGSTLKAPLWNRTIKPTSYQTYNQLGTTSLMGQVSQPGYASLTCLSCHDGQTAVDSIINMPGSGMGLLSQATFQNNDFLNTWNNAKGPDAVVHMGFSSVGVGSNIPGGPITVPGNYKNTGCMVCHSPLAVDTNPLSPGFGTTTGGNTDFTMALIGTDLRNDHPVGIDFPIALANTPGSDWNKPANSQGSSLYFEETPNGRMDKNEIRLYEGKVECASCHDPHGVPTAGPGSVFNKTFLRKQNTDTSKVCLTCHNK